MKYKIKDITLYGYHGVNDDEKKKGQYFIISISYLDKSLVSVKNVLSKSDNLSGFIDYMDIYQCVKKVFNQRRYNLIETLSANIYSEISRKFPISQIEITITKKYPGNKNNINNVSFKLKK